MSSKVYITKEELLTNINIQMMDEMNIKIIKNLYVSEADKNEMYIVGCKIEEKFIKLPKVALEIINYIRKYNNVSNISNYIGNDIEYKDFVISMISLGFIEQYGEYQIIKPSDSSNVKRFGLKLKSKYLDKPYVDIFFSKKFI
ncbi:hypothetical protein, partial [Paenibacillus sp. 7516]|uniref:hypothetical protein n=1 Tax=Paenibacillus sp. 7516 TaxID=2022549 RepID=UPI001140AD54